ncbi:hypothetical protein BH10BAC5_BH10BAC5_11780 [soil metagenome]
MKEYFFILLLILLPSIIFSAQGPTYKIWNTSNSPIPTNSLRSIFIDKDGIIWIGSGDKGLIKFDGINFTNFNTLNSPMKADWAPYITSDKFNNLWIATFKTGAGNQGALMKFDRVNTWSYFNNQNSGISNGNQWCVAVDTNNIIWSFGFKLSKYDGTIWTVYDSTNSPLKFSGGREIYVDKFNNKWIGLDFYGLYKLENDAIWTYYSPQNSGIGGTEVNKIREDNFGNLWITMSYYGITKFDPINNLWQNWTPQNSGLHWGHPWGLQFDKKNIKWIGFNFGDTLCSFNDTNFIYHNPLGGFNNYDIKLDILGNLWMATSAGLIEYNKNGIVVDVNNQISPIPESFKIENIFPNPFNPKANIKFTISKHSNLKVKLYNIKGEELETLLNKDYQAGEYEANWNAQSYSSGIYFVTFYVNNILFTSKKLLLIK